MLLAEGIFLCTLFWGVCWFGTGSDEKNIRNFSSYPEVVQKIVILPRSWREGFDDESLWSSSQTICFCLLYFFLHWDFLPVRRNLQETF